MLSNVRNAYLLERQSERNRNQQYSQSDFNGGQKTTHGNYILLSVLYILGIFVYIVKDTKLVVKLETVWGTASWGKIVISFHGLVRLHKMVGIILNYSKRCA